MKLAFLNDSIYHYAAGMASAVGGAERQQWLLARALASSGWSVTVGVSKGLDAGERTRIDNVEFAGIGQGYGHIMSAWYRFLFAERPAWWYWRCASHLLGPAFSIAKLLGVRTIFSAALDLDVNPRRALFLRARWWPLYAWGLAWADRIFVQHGGQLAGIAENLRSKTYVIPSIAGETMSAKAHCQREKYVAWVGQLKRPKRPDLLIEMARQASSLRFIVCGGSSTFMSENSYSGEIIGVLRRLPNVEYRGQVSPGDALQVIADAAIFLSTSDEEGFPNTFLQAWASGTPVVSLTTDPDGVIKRKKLGAVSNSLNTAIATIGALMTAPEQRDAIAARARRYVEEHHSEAAVLGMFNRAIQGTPHRAELS